MRDGRAHLQPVETGLMNDELAEITHGLEPNELVVLAPETSLKDGIAVRPIEREIVEHPRSRYRLTRNSQPNAATRKHIHRHRRSQRFGGRVRSPVCRRWSERVDCRLNDSVGNGLTAELGPAMRYRHTDVTQRDRRTSGHSSLVRHEFGGLHGLIQCAGILGAARIVGKESPHDLALFATRSASQSGRHV